ncbi:MAG: single-stranded DNA-binding protein [Spirochaetaceae bacterium]|jgi:single-strand DNA-binding protein|nr:single-stranded DNA-binding protein [Spirochaetaceae bacterium]
MIDLNHVSLIGRLTRDAEYKVLPSGQAVCNFSIAVNRRRKSGDSWEDEANYFDIVLWGKQADSLNRYLVKGKQIGVDGELRQDRWQQEGQNRSKVVVSATNVQLLGGGPGQGGGQGGYSAPAANSYQGGSGGHSGGSYSGGGYSGGYGGGGPSYGGDADGGADNARSDHQFTDDIPF